MDINGLLGHKMLRSKTPCYPSLSHRINRGASPVVPSRPGWTSRFPVQPGRQNRPPVHTGMMQNLIPNWGWLMGYERFKFGFATLVYLYPHSFSFLKISTTVSALHKLAGDWAPENYDSQLGRSYQLFAVVCCCKAITYIQGNNYGR